MAHQGGAMQALLKIKQEPVDTPRTWPRMEQLALERPSLMEFEKLGSTTHRSGGLLTDATRTRMRTATTAGKRKSRAQEPDVPEDYGVPADELQNSDEESSRRVRRAEFAKTMQSVTKRARRKPDPPDEWKDALDRERPDNVRLNEADCLRTHASVGFIGPVQGEVELSPEGVVSITDDAARAQALKRLRAGVPLSRQERVISAPPILRDEVRERLDEVTEEIGERALVPVYAVNRPLRYGAEARADTWLMGMPEKQRKKQIVVPARLDLAEFELDEVMRHAQTDEQGQVLAQVLMWNAASCNYADTNFIARKLKEEGIYNCPLSRVGAMDDYFAVMTANYRRVDENLLRQPLDNERRCLEEEACKGRQIPNSVQITLVEYIDDEMLRSYLSTRQWPQARRHCVLCRRSLATKAFFAMLAECAAYSDSMAARVKVSREGAYESARRPLMLCNFYNFAGEYSPYDMLVSNVNRFVGIAAPIVIFFANRYTQYRDENGLLRYRQDYPAPNRNLREWATHVSRELSLGTRRRHRGADRSRPRRRPTDYFLPRPPM